MPIGTNLFSANPEAIDACAVEGSDSDSAQNGDIH
jgi:hypothetical protein